jgi:hypothetical protein
VRPWRTATIVASLVAAVELVALLAGGVILLAKPLSHTLQRQAEEKALAPPKPAKAVAILHPTPKPIAKPKLTRAHTRILVLNGNGQDGAAATAAGRLERLGYKIAATGNARRQDYAASVVMYRPGYHPEAVRLAHDLGVKVVGPLDGLRAAALEGGQLAIIVGP